MNIDLVFSERHVARRALTAYAINQLEAAKGLVAEADHPLTYVGHAQTLRDRAEAAMSVARIARGLLERLGGEMPEVLKDVPVAMTVDEVVNMFQMRPEEMGDDPFAALNAATKRDLEIVAKFLG
jgi:hypothetical protein